MPSVTENTAVFRMDKRIKACAAKDNSRYAIAGVLVVPKIARAVVTDGRCLVIRSVEVESEGDPVILPVEILGGPCSSVPATFSVNGDCRNITNGKIAAPIEGTFPPYADVVPKMDESDDEGARYVGINAKILANVAKALGTDGAVYLRIDADWRAPIVVIPTNAQPSGDDGDDAAIGLVMPIGHPNHKSPAPRFRERRALALAK